MARPIPELDPMTAIEVAADDNIIIDDTSAGETKRIPVGDLLGLPSVGWTAAGETWSFVSWNATTKVGVVQVPSDATLKYALDNFVRFVQTTGGVKYGKILSLTSTQLTIWMPSHTLNNEAITIPNYSPLASPLGTPIAVIQGNPYRFSAYRATTTQATSGGVPTKVQFQAERYDPNANYDSVTNYRYTVPVTGLYFMNALIQTLLGSTATDSNLAIYRNGSIMRKGGNLKNGVYPQHQVVGEFELTAGDYLEVFFVNIASGDSIEGTTGTSSAFEGSLRYRTA